MGATKDLRREIEVMLCTLAAEWVSQDRGGTELTITSKQPDVSNRRDPSVDLECRDHFGRILVEHTQLDHFEGAVAAGVNLQRMFAGDYGVRVECPEGAQWQLRIPERWLRRNRKSLRDAGDELAEWVRRELADESIFNRLSTVPLWIHGQDSPHLWRWTT